MVIKQISVFVENKNGRLAEITQLLAENHIDIRAISIADTTHFGILRLIVDNPDAAQKILRSAGFTVSITDVIAVGFDDVPGGLSNALKVLTAAGIDVAYIYAFISRESKTAYVILRVEDIAATLEEFRKAGIPVLSARDVYEA